MTIQKMTPAAIIAETRTEVDRLSGGQVPFKTLYPLHDILVKPLMTGHLVPNNGWTFTQIQDTTTSGTDGTVFTGTQLEQELRRNPAFEEAIFCITPHWQGSMHKVSTNPRGTVKFAYVDEDGRITAQAKRNGVFLFNEKTRFVPTGDVTTIILCGRCHQRHTTQTTMPRTAQTNTTGSESAGASSHALTVGEDTTRDPLSAS
ncbi:hypothetical protein EDB86DRAFT_2838036 [Lactarius hatsudake]|nr:hypothetical protein EDB86DRAFT_2838036 [Lactarius hatsudake]